jgi:hypothetical protein
MFWSASRPARQFASLKAQMRVDDSWIDITIANVSSTGLMARCNRPPQVGSQVELRKRGVVIAGEIVWTTGSRFGLRSFDRIDTAALLAPSDLQRDRRATTREDVDRRTSARWWSWQRAR